jgi:hypothetical protein
MLHPCLHILLAVYSEIDRGMRRHVMHE